MTTILYAQPYDISATGFYFKSEQQFQEAAQSAINAFGQSVEEFEIQFIDGDTIDAQLAEALSLSQCNMFRFLELVDQWDDFQKTKYILWAGESAMDFDIHDDDIDDVDIDIYSDMSLYDLAQQFVDEGLFGDIPSHLINYIDFEAIARDLSLDYCESIIAGQRVIYRCD